MINTQEINSFQLNTVASLNSFFQDGAILADEFGFNGLGLHNDNIYITFSDDENGTEQELRTQGYPTDVGRQILIQRDDEKRIEVKGVICYDVGTTGDEKRENFQKYLDDFKRKLFVDSGFLDIKVGSIVRRYKATLINRGSIFDLSGKQINYREFTLKFEILDDEPYGKEPNYTAISKFDIADTDYLVDAASVGNAPSKLIAIMIVKSSTNVTSVKIHNNTRSETLKYTGSLSAGDVLKFDCDERAIRLNDSKQKPRGTWLSVGYGNNSIQVEVDADSIEYDLTLKWKQSFV